MKANSAQASYTILLESLDSQQQISLLNSFRVQFIFVCFSKLIKFTVYSTLFKVHVHCLKIANSFNFGFHPSIKLFLCAFVIFAVYLCIYVCIEAKIANKKHKLKLLNKF